MLNMSTICSGSTLSLSYQFSAAEENKTKECLQPSPAAEDQLQLGLHPVWTIAPGQQCASVVLFLVVHDLRESVSQLASPLTAAGSGWSASTDHKVSLI